MKWHGLKRTPIQKLSPQQRVELRLRSKLKAELIAGQEYPHCMTCGTAGDFRGLSLSHIIALSRGGKTIRENCLIECYVCHSKYEKRPGLRDKAEEDKQA